MGETWTPPASDKEVTEEKAWTPPATDLPVEEIGSKKKELTLSSTPSHITSGSFLEQLSSGVNKALPAKSPSVSGISGSELGKSASSETNKFPGIHLDQKENFDEQLIAGQATPGKKEQLAEQMRLSNIQGDIVKKNFIENSAALDDVKSRAKDLQDVLNNPMAEPLHKQQAQAELQALTPEYNKALEKAKAFGNIYQQGMADLQSKVDAVKEYAKQNSNNLEGSVQQLGLSTADALDNFQGVNNFLSKYLFGHEVEKGKGGYEYIADKLRNASQDHLNNMEEGFVGDVLKGVVSTVPLLAEATVVPGGFVTAMGANALGGEYKKSGNALDAIQAGAEGAAEGMVFHQLGELGVKSGNYVNAKTGSDILDKSTGALVTSLGFGGYDAAKQYAETGNINWNTVAASFGTGIAFSIPTLAAAGKAKAMDDLLTATPEAIQQAVDVDKSVDELRGKSIEVLEKAHDGEDGQEKAQAIQAGQALGKIANVKSAVDIVVADPQKAIADIKNLPVKDDIKQGMIDKVNLVVAQHDPKSIASKPIEAQINMLQEGIDNNNNNKSLTDVQREIQNKLSEEKIKELKGQIENIYNPNKLPNGKPEILEGQSVNFGKGFVPSMIDQGDGVHFKVDDTNEGGKKSAGMIGFKKVLIDGKNYLSVGMTNVRDGYEGKGLGTNMYRYVLQNLPEGIEGIVSPKVTRWNREQIPKIHEKLANEFETKKLSNGDIIFTPKENAAKPEAEQTEGVNKTNENAIQESSSGTLGTHQNGEESTGNKNSEGIRQGEQGKEIASEKEKVKSLQGIPDDEFVNKFINSGFLNSVGEIGESRVNFGLPTAEVKKAISDLKKGKESAAVKHLKEQILNIKETGDVPIIKGTGGTSIIHNMNLADFHDMINDADVELNPKEKDVANQLPDDLTRLVDEEGITLENFDKFENSKLSALYSPEDFKIIKNHLENEKRNSETGQGESNSEHEQTAEKSESPEGASQKSDEVSGEPKATTEQVNFYEKHKDKLFEEYTERFGNKVDPDSARELFRVLGYDKETNVVEFRAIGKQLTVDVFNHILEKNKGKTDRVIFAAGLPATGKSRLLEHNHPNAVIYDGTINTEKSFKNLIDLAIKQGYKPEVQMYISDPERAFKSNLKRERKAPISQYEKVAKSLNNRVKFIKENYGDKVKISIFDHTNFDAKELPSDHKINVSIDRDKFNQILNETNLTDEQKQRIRGDQPSGVSKKTVSNDGGGKNDVGNVPKREGILPEPEKGKSEPDGSGTQQSVHETRNGDLPKNGVDKVLENTSKKQPESIQEAQNMFAKGKLNLKELQAELERLRKSDAGEALRKFSDKLRDKGKIGDDIAMSGIPFAKEVWNGAIDLTADAINAGADFVDAVKVGIDHIKSTDWYKKLADADKLKAESKFNNNFDDLISVERKQVKSEIEKDYKNLEKILFGSETPKEYATGKGGLTLGTSKLQDKTVGKVKRYVGEGIDKAVEKQLTSQNGYLRNFGQVLNNVFRLGITPERMGKQSEFIGGKERAVGDAAYASDVLKKIVGNSKESLERVHQVMDPELYGKDGELFDGKGEKTITYEDLTPEEKKLHDVLRQINYVTHKINFAIGKLSYDTYVKNKGSYIGRLYKEFEMPDDLKEQVRESTKKMSEGIYKQRGELDNWKLENKITDPVYITTKRLYSTLMNKAVSDYADYIARDKTNLISDVERPGFTKLGNGYGELSNKFVADTVAEDFKGFFFTTKIVQQAYDLFKSYNNWAPRQFYKKLVTIYNPGTQLGNIMGDNTFAFLSGVDPITLNKNTIGFARDEVKNYGETYRYLLSKGLLKSDLTREDLSNSLKNYDDMIEEASKTKNPFKYLKDKANDVYSSVDDLYKIGAFKSLVDKGIKPEDAIRQIENGFQNGNKIPKIYDFASKIPVIGNPFGRWGADLARITSNSITTRPLQTAAFLGSLSLLSYISSQMSGETDEEKKVRTSRAGAPKIPFPNWLGGDIPLAYKIGKHELNVARFLTPMYTYGSFEDDDTRQALMKFSPLSIDFVDRTQNPSGKLAVFLAKNTHDPLAKVLQLIFDADFTGKPIFDPKSTIYKESTLTTEEKTSNALRFLAREYVPFAKEGESLYDAATGQDDSFGRKRSVPQALLSMLGIKIQEFGDDQYVKAFEGSIKNKGYEFVNNAKVINDIRTQLLNDKIDKETAEKRLAPLLEKQALIVSEIKSEAEKVQNKFKDKATEDVLDEIKGYQKAINEMD